MYLTLKNLDRNMVAHIQELPTRKEKIQAYHNYVSSFDIEGIQLESRYNELGLSIDELPYDILEHYRLTYHINGVRELFTDEDEEIHHHILAQAYELVTILPAIEDISFHPPGFFPPQTESHIPDGLRNQIKERFQRILAYWIPKYKTLKTSISIESHISEQYFVFKGPEDYIQFFDTTPHVGALIDTAHNHFDGFDNTALSKKLAKRITGFHISDAIQKADFSDGLHLAIGQGEIDFQFLNTFSSENDVYGAIEIKGSFNDIQKSFSVLKNVYSSAFPDF